MACAEKFIPTAFFCFQDRVVRLMLKLLRCEFLLRAPERHAGSQRGCPPQLGAP